MNGEPIDTTEVRSTCLRIEPGPEIAGVMMADIRNSERLVGSVWEASKDSWYVGCLDCGELNWGFNSSDAAIAWLQCHRGWTKDVKEKEWTSTEKEFTIEP